MSVVKVYNISGENKETIDLNDEIFNVEIRKPLIHEVVKAYLNNQRQGTKATKSRGEVNGTGKRPWRQKGTGRARAGNIKSPVWVGGGHTFALKPKDYTTKISRKKRVSAIKCVLSSRLKEDKLIILDDFNFEKPKTKDFNVILDNLKVYSTALLVLPEINKNTILSTNNIPGITTSIYKDINTHDILKHKTLIIIKSAVKKLEEELQR